MFSGSYVWLRPPPLLVSGREGRWAPQGETARSHRDWTSLSWETITTSPPPNTLLLSCSFLLCLSTTVLFFLSLTLTLCLFHPSPGALYTPLFIYVSGDGNGLPPREEGWEGGELWVRAHGCGVFGRVRTCRHIVYTVCVVMYRVSHAVFRGSLWSFVTSVQVRIPVWFRIMHVHEDAYPGDVKQYPAGW